MRFQVVDTIENFIQRNKTGVCLQFTCWDTFDINTHLIRFAIIHFNTFTFPCFSGTRYDHGFDRHSIYNLSIKPSFTSFLPRSTLPYFTVLPLFTDAVADRDVSEMVQLSAK